MPPTKSRWSGWRTFAAAALLAVATFVQFSVVLKTPYDGKVYGDGLKYIFYAYNLKHHRTFSHVQSFGPGHESATVNPDKLTLPGYPAFLSLFFNDAPAGGNLVEHAVVKRAMLAQAALGVVSTLLAYLIALRLLPLWWAFAAGLMVAILPHLAVANTHLLTEPLFTTLMLAAVHAILVAACPDAKVRHYVIAGLLVGLASMVRPQLQLVPLIAVAAVGMQRQLRPYFVKILIATACFAAIMAPWYWRNAGIERPVGDNDLFVTTLYHGSFPSFMYQDDPRTFGYPYYFDPDQARVTRDLPAIATHIADHFATEPGKYLRWYLLGKPSYFLAWATVEGPGDIFIYPTKYSPYLSDRLFMVMRDISFVLHWPLMLLAVSAALIALWRPRLLATDNIAVVILGTFFAYLIVIHAIGAPFPRYNIPFRPIAFILALVLARALADKLHVRSKSSGLPSR